MCILAIEAALPRPGLAILTPDGETLARHILESKIGLIETLPPLLQSALHALQAAGQGLTHIAVGIGPGSFTGLRTAIALAQGVAAAAGLPLHGIPASEAFAAAFPTLQRPLWVAIRARRDRIFLIRDTTSETRAEAYADAAIPRPPYPIALAGDAANEAAAHYAARNMDIMLTNARNIDPVWTARACLARLTANLPAHPAQPLYVDPPEAKLPAAGLRPVPL